MIERMQKADVPMGTNEKRVAYREAIRRDIMEAIEGGIDAFEFKGDYNYAYLAQYAREEAKRLFLERIENAVDRLMAERRSEIEKAGLVLRPKYALIQSDTNTQRFYKVTRKKDGDGYRVFMKLNLDEQDLLDEAKKVYNRAVNSAVMRKGRGL